METVNIEIGTKNVKITREKIFSCGNTSTETFKVCQDTFLYCLKRYIKTGDIVLMKPTSKGQKTSDFFFSAIRSISDMFETKSDIIEGLYMAGILNPIFRLHTKNI